MNDDSILREHITEPRSSGLGLRLALAKWFGVTTTDAERGLDMETDVAEEIVGHVLRMQHNAAKAQQRPICRGTHAKGICVRASMEVFDLVSRNDSALASRLSRGTFARPGFYPAIVRFANSDPQVNADTKPDVRAMSVSVDLSGGLGSESPAGARRQDFSLQSAPTLPLNDPRAFLATMKVLTASSPLKGLLRLSFGDQRRVVRAIALAQLQSRQPLRPYQKLRYWSTVPFRHGGTDIVKQCATPLSTNPARPLDRASPDSLRNELGRHVANDETMSGFDIGLQFLDPSRMTYGGKHHDASFWIENASVEWKEAEASFHSVAQLTLTPNSTLPDVESNAIYFDVTQHAAPESAPAGGINRVRWRSEAASRAVRLRAAAAVEKPAARCPF